MEHSVILSYQDYMLHGIAVRIGWDNEQVSRWLHLLLAHFGLMPAEQPVTPQIALNLCTQAAPLIVPGDAIEVDQHNGVRTLRSHDQLYIGDDDLTIRLNPQSGHGHGVFQTAQAQSALRPDLIVCALILLLRHQGIFALHAACLEYNGTGYVFVADSDHGKSTLACSLMRQGWRYLSDDSIFLQPQDHGLKALAFRKDLLLDPEAEDYFPDIVAHWTPHHVADAGKRLLQVEAAYPARTATSTMPKVLIFPRIIDADQSELAPLDKASGLHHLVRQSLVVTFEPIMAARHLDVLKRLLDQAQSYQLNAGRDVLQRPSQVASRLAELAPSMAKESS